MTHAHAGPQFAPEPHHRGLRPNAPVIRPSPIPANAQTEQEILAEMARQQQVRLRMSGPGPGPVQGPAMSGHIGNVGQGGIQPSREDCLIMISRRPFHPEVLKTPEAISLQSAVEATGSQMLDTFLYQFVYGAMEHGRREILLQVRKLLEIIKRGLVNKNYSS